MSEGTKVSVIGTPCIELKDMLTSFSLAELDAFWRSWDAFDLSMDLKLARLVNDYLISRYNRNAMRRDSR